MSESNRPGDDALRRTVVLVGFRGCGKTSVGRLLARRLGWKHVDLDDLIETSSGLSIRTIFERHGEDYFRWREAEDLRALLHRSSQPFVLSLGGGTLILETSRKQVQRLGHCIWLAASAEELNRRIEADPQSYERRPSLTPLEQADEIRTLLSQREPLYAQVAHVRIDTDGQTMEQVVDAAFATLAGIPARAPESRS